MILQHFKHLTSRRLNRFLLAGAANTTVNFIVLNSMVSFMHADKILSIIIATSFAILCSFALNRNLVFIDKSRPAKQFLRFTLITVGGVLLIQTSVYAVGIALLHHHEAGLMILLDSLLKVRIAIDVIDVNLSNVIASITVMFWNYNGYRIFVFTSSRWQNEYAEDYAEPA